jgi:hypothetical protein
VGLGGQDERGGPRGDVSFRTGVVGFKIGEGGGCRLPVRTGSPRCRLRLAYSPLQWRWQGGRRRQNFHMKTKWEGLRRRKVKRRCQTGSAGHGR